MRPEDINQFIRKALEDIEAVDAEQQAHFGRLREKVREGGEAAAKALREVEDATRSANSPERKDLTNLARERGRIAEAIKPEMASAFAEHADLIERIAKSRRRPAG